MEQGRSLSIKTSAPVATSPLAETHRASIDSNRTASSPSTAKPVKGFFASLANKILKPNDIPSPRPSVEKVPRQSISYKKLLSSPKDEVMLALNQDLTQLELFKRLHEQWETAVADGVQIDAKHRINLSSFLAVMHGSAHLEIADAQALDVALQTSIDILAQRNNDVYGVNTGFGGNADMRSDDAQAVQVGLIKHLNAGMSNHIHDAEITRGAMILRVLSMSRGGSAVRLQLIEILIKLIEARVTPCVPLRGSISASGDLMPLSYVAGLISGRFQNAEKAATGPKGEFLTGKQALLAAGIPQPITFAAKEALALVNGTSFSCSMAASCALDAHSLTLLVQVLTAFSTEALAGHVDAFDPAVARLRPHPGQVELCANISYLLRDSNLVGNNKSVLVPLLWRRTMPQDRYSIRTAPQWLCPLVECLTQITKTLEIEINSVTDNPLVDIVNNKILHAGNFQALSVADTMDRLLLSQGLPANLAWGHPGTDFGFKGLDVSMASYLSELGDLALPISVHVQSAELHNQAVNSLALISARKTQKAIEVLQMMLSCLIASLCQAADLRALESAISQRVQIVMNAFASKLLEHREIGWTERVAYAVEFATGKLVFLPECKDVVAQLVQFGETLRREVLVAIETSQKEVGTGKGDRVLSSSAKKVYMHIRKTKNIPMYKDEKEFIVGRMLDRVLAFVKNRKEVDSLILSAFEGIEEATFADEVNSNSSETENDSETALDDVTASEPVEVIPAATKLV
ncbi:L-Aspartase-like protein [Obelidium mucronatum]|nr:L-Aspartase-like protein [Obelidium mucronatum]